MRILPYFVSPVYDSNLTAVAISRMQQTGIFLMYFRNRISLTPENKTKLLFLLFFILLITSSFFILPNEDSYYYWDWNRHLALSYYDGPPLIAYSLRVFTEIFGNTIIAINLLGVITICLISFLIYKTTQLILNQQAALYAGLLWLLSPLVIHYLFTWVTYDNLLNLFWAATIYLIVRHIKFNKPTDIYLTACCTGLLLLSKYTGVVLLAALFLFMISNTSYRNTLVKNKHFYIAILLIILITSPVLIWNYKNHWVSFYYQLTVHTANHWSWHSIIAYLVVAMANYNILLFLSLYVIFKNYPSIKENSTLVLLNIISFSFLLFFFYQSFDHTITKHWLVPFCISSTILCGCYLMKYNWHKLFWLIICFYFLISTCYITFYSVFQKYIDSNMAVYALIKQAGQKYLTQNQLPIVTANWQMASKLAFWLSNKPYIYTLPCGLENQYAYWSNPLLESIKGRRIKKILYLNLNDDSNCIKKYFTYCKALPMLSYKYDDHYLIKKNNNAYVKLHVYQCFI